MNIPRLISLLSIVIALFMSSARVNAHSKTTLFLGANEHKKIICQGTHPDSVCGDYDVICDDENFAYRLTLQPDGTFLGHSFILGTHNNGHWDIGSDGNLILNTGHPQIEVEEMILYFKEGKSIYLLEKQRPGHYFGSEKVNLAIGTEQGIVYKRSDDNGKVDLSRRVSPTYLKIQNLGPHTLLNIYNRWYQIESFNYKVQVPWASNVFIVRLSCALEFDNLKWSSPTPNSWTPIDPKYTGFRIVKVQSPVTR